MFMRNIKTGISFLSGLGLQAFSKDQLGSQVQNGPTIGVCF